MNSSSASAEILQLLPIRNPRSFPEFKECIDTIFPNSKNFHYFSRSKDGAGFQDVCEPVLGVVSESRYIMNSPFCIIPCCTLFAFPVPFKNISFQ